MGNFFLPTVNALLLLTSLKACDWSGHIFGASASVRLLTKKLAIMSPSSTVHGGQHGTKYVTFELLLHAAFVADEIWGFMLEPARIYVEVSTKTTKNTHGHWRCWMLDVERYMERRFIL